MNAAAKMQPMHLGQVLTFAFQIVTDELSDLAPLLASTCMLQNHAGSNEGLV